MRDRRARVKAWSQSLWEGHLNPILIAIPSASVHNKVFPKPTHLILGEADAIVGPDQLTGLSDTSTQMIAESGHFDLIHPATAAFEQVLKALEYLMQTGSTSGG
jgi:hypothetical protein